MSHANDSDLSGAGSDFSGAGRRWLTAFSLIIIGLYALFFIFLGGHTGPEDGDQFLVFHSLQYWNAALFGLAKQWTPVMCAGLSLAGEPQVPFMSLSMALSYMLGPLWGVRLATMIYFALGWSGAYLYAGLWLRHRAQRFLAASLFIGNGFFVCRLGMGHLDFIPFLILPLELWVLHRSLERPPQGTFADTVLRFTLAVLLMGASIALVIDGSPVAIIHLMFWIGLYAIVLAITSRSYRPALLFAFAVVLASVLDAGYVWPMLQAQESYPRLGRDRFTSVFSFLWFAILPLRGKVLPANGNGHELSVFIGPVLAYCVWRYRHRLLDDLPATMKRPLLVVSLVSLVLGMGSLKNLHVPVWLSPFDLLRPLPGFRSMGITGRYWGFLALPLSLLSAAALWKYVWDSRVTRHLHVVLGIALALQFGFQAETLSTHWLHSPLYRPVKLDRYFRQGPETIQYVGMQGGQMQGQLIGPTRGINNCYDMDDFNRPDAVAGNALVTRVVQEWRTAGAAPSGHAAFASWNRINVELDCPATDGASCLGSGNANTRVTLRQAYHEFWKAPSCTTHADAHGRLQLECPASRLREGTVQLTFDDAVSVSGARVSTLSWKLWGWITGIIIVLIWAARRQSGYAGLGGRHSVIARQERLIGRSGEVPATSAFNPPGGSIGRTASYITGAGRDRQELNPPS